jgi:hypothetical protein
VDAATARNIAQYSHLDRRDRFGEPIVEHVERVAAAVPEDARVVAYLHDVLEHSDTSMEELIADGLTPVEYAAIELLTRSRSDAFELYVLRIAHASGRAGELARVVKLADLDDHLAHSAAPLDAPPYGWARLHILAALDRTTGQAA